ncbi:MAG: hypothetical protein MUP82_00410 [Candidatus Marinimicrobia bacterium]|nr:hypothetical protein [Candidatus Neomarinimicrobiota bacterium]
MANTPFKWFKNIFNKHANLPKEIQPSPFEEREKEVTIIIEEKLPDLPRPLLLHYIDADWSPSEGYHIKVMLEVPWTGQTIQVAIFPNIKMTAEQQAEIIISGMAFLRK